MEYKVNNKKMHPKKVTDRFRVGMEIFYFNLWNKYENLEIRDSFVSPTKEQFKNLQPGDEIFVDREPYYHHGKVYGYTVDIITGSAKETSFGYMVETKSGSAYLSKTKVLDPKVAVPDFIDLVNSIPFALSLFPSEERMG